MNNFKTFILLAGLTALFLLIGEMIAGHAGLIIALVFALMMNFSAYWFSDKMVLQSFKARPLDNDDPIYQLIAQLAKKAQIPMPKAYLVEDPTPNAFATGRNPEHAAIAVTSGILQQLSQEELTGVLAHEMSHITHRDTLISTISASIAGAISAFANLFQFGAMANAREDSSEQPRSNPLFQLIMIFVAPMLAGLMQMAVSRSREFEADAGGAHLCGHPLWLASALGKLEQANRHGQFQAAKEHPNTAPLFIVNPLRGEHYAQWFTTHPPTAERIKRLKEMVV